MNKTEPGYRKSYLSESGKGYKEKETTVKHVLIITIRLWPGGLGP